MAGFSGFPPDTIKFLKTLKRNNNRDWFAKNKERYESAFVEPSLQFIDAIGQQLKTISPCFFAVPKKSGGSLMRIYRDTRFAKDKTPYKLNIGIHFRHEVGKDVHAPGFYVHIQPGDCFIGVGIWHPEPRVAKQIRTAIDDDPAAWKKAAHAKSFTSKFTLAGESLKRPPKDFDPEHTYVNDLKRKDFIGVQNIDDAAIHDPKFVKQTIVDFKKAKPLMKFLCDALDLRY